MTHKYNKAIVGGTFDHLHAGHERLLTEAFEQAAYVAIGIATDSLFQQKVHANLIEDFATRKASVEKFLSQHHLHDRTEIVPISDFFGTSLTDQTIEAIFITESNQANVDTINAERKKIGFTEITAVIVPYVLGPDGEHITSQKIRSGLIDRQGNKYLDLFTTRELFHLPHNDREALRVPFGPIFTSLDELITFCKDKPMVIAVGDVIANSLHQHAAQASISIIDGKTQRNEIVDNEQLTKAANRQHVQNEAGTIRKEAVTCLQAAIDLFQETNQKQVIQVSGEEDLLAIPSIVLSPLNTVVVYGLYSRGIVAVEVSEQSKQDIQNLFRKFQ